MCVTGDASCPRGTRRAGAECARTVSCPPGSLVTSAPGDGGATACRPIVTLGAREGLPRVDVGAWTAIVLGVDGGPGTDDLCAPLSLRLDAFGLPGGEGGSVDIRIGIVIVAPDEDLTRVHTRVSADLSTESGERPLSPEAEDLVERSVATLVEPLRSLGGEAAGAAVELKVSCRVR